MYQQLQSCEMTAMLHDVDFSAYTHNDILTKPAFKRRRSVIIATLTNRTVTDVDVQKLMEAGMNAARFRTPHQSKRDKIKLLEKIEMAITACCQKYSLLNWPVATCNDLKTRSVKTGLLEQLDVPFIMIKARSEVILTCDVSYFNKCNSQRIFVDNPYLTTEVKVGMEIFIDGDEIALICTDIKDAKSVKAAVVNGGRLKDLCVVCFRGLKSSRPFITKSDIATIKFVMDNEVDAIVLNYVEDAEAIKKVKKCFGKIRRPVILSGICNEAGIDNIDEIAKESDGIILSREYLPYEIGASFKYRFNNIQKWLAAKCQQAGKPLYLSGNVLQSAIRTGAASGSEVSDVSNAILDGFSGFILRECENIDNTIETVRLLNEICCDVEPYTYTKTNFWRLTDQFRIPVNAAEASVMSCVALANQIDARVIILPTVSGRTAKALLQMRPCCIVLAVCTSPRVTRMLQMYKCMVPLLYSGEPSKIFHLTLAARVNFAVEYAVKMDWLQYGDTYAVLKRASDGSSYCDMVNILTVTISTNSAWNEIKYDAGEDHEDSDSLKL